MSTLFSKVTLWSLIVLVTGTLLFPDTFTNVGLRIGSLRISFIAVLFILTVPIIAFYICINRRSLRLGTLDVCLVALAGYMCLRGVIATDQVNMMGLLAAYAGYSLAVYYGTAIVAQQKNALRIIMWSVAVIGCLIVLYGLLEFLLNRDIIFEGIIDQDRVSAPGEDYFRIGSTLGHPVALGLFLVQLAPFLIYFLIGSRKKIARIAWSLAILASVVALESTFTKGAWGTALIIGGVAAVVLIWRYPQARRQVVISFLLITLLLGAFSILFSDSVRSGIFSEQRRVESFSPRLYMWERAPLAFLEHPFFGVGMGQGNIEVAKINPDNRKLLLRPIAIDNLYLTTLVEEGLVGFTLLGATLILIGRQAWMLIRNQRALLYLVLPATTVVAATLIDGFTFDSLLVWPNMVIFWLAAGIIRALTESGLQLRATPA